MSLILQALRNSARGEECQLRIPGVCSYDPAETVLAHLYPAGRSMGQKSPDWCATFACAHCHAAIDQHKLPHMQELEFAFRGMARTWQRWIELGLIQLPEDPETAKRRPGRPANLPTRKLQSRPMSKGRKFNGRRGVKRDPEFD